MPCRHLVLTLALLTAFVSGGFAQTSAEGHARLTALGGSTTALREEASGTANPAAWATFSRRVISFSASEAFGMAALRLASVIYIEPTRHGVLLAGAGTFGFDDFRETHLQVGVARGFHLGSTRRFHVGLNVRFQRIAIPGYGQAGTVVLDAGGLVNIHPSVHFGFQTTNLTGARLAAKDDLPRSLSIGVGYHPVRTVLLVLDAYKDLRFPMSVRSGLELHPVTPLFLRAGITTRPTRFSVGTGFRLGKLAADVALERHIFLGWTPAISLGIHW